MLFHSNNPRLGNIAGVKEELAPFLLAIHLFLLFFMHCNISRCFTYQTAIYAKNATNVATISQMGNIDRRFQSLLYM